MSAADKVVIAVDDSQYAEAAFNWYFAHMHKPNNKVILVHAMELPTLPSRDAWEAQTKTSREKAESIKEKFQDLLEEHKVQPYFVMDFEKPGEMVCEAAEKEHADVIVMGTRGMGKLRRTLMGSVSNFVLNHAHCPVLVVRKEKEPAE